MEFALVSDLVILAGALAFVGWPLANPARAEADATAKQKRRTALDDEKERLLAALSDLEHDHATGKMEDADFATLSARVKGDAARVLREIDLNEGKRLLRPGESPETERPKAIEPGSSIGARSHTDAESDEVARLKKQLESVEADRKRLEAENRKNEERVAKASKKVPAHEEVRSAEGAFCTKCGRQAKSSSDRFCGKCGTPFPDDLIN